MADISEDENAFLLKRICRRSPRMPCASARKTVCSHQRRAQTGKRGAGQEVPPHRRAYGRFVRSFVLPDNVDPTR